MKKETIHPKGLVKRPFYSHVVKVGNTIYVAGQVSRDENGKIVGVGDFRAQAEKVFENLQLALKAAGATLEDVVATTSYLTNMAYSPILAEVTAKYFGEQAPPTATWVAVSSLAQPEFLLEIEAVAVVG
jgi:enamine deaminase RidA (YjgF/YER057c/UK114 family)